MSELKTKATGSPVAAFLGAIKDEAVRRDCGIVAGIMQDATKSKPKMWGSSIVGFGERRLKYPNGREIDWMVTAFSPRKQAITLYLSSEFKERDTLLKALGKHSCGGGCVYIKRLSDVHLPTLKKLVKASVRHTKKNN